MIPFSLNVSSLLLTNLFNGIIVSVTFDIPGTIRWSFQSIEIRMSSQDEEREETVEKTAILYQQVLESFPRITLHICPCPITFQYLGSLH